MTQCFSSGNFLLSIQMFFSEHKLSILSSAQLSFSDRYLCFNQLQEYSLHDVPKPGERISSSIGIHTEMVFSLHLCLYHLLQYNDKFQTYKMPFCRKPTDQHGYIHYHNNHLHKGCSNGPLDSAPSAPETALKAVPPPM